MTATLVRLLPVDEMAVLKCYVEGSSETQRIQSFYDELGIAENKEVPRGAIAVAQILLHEIQGSLPQWASVREEEVSLNRKEHHRHKDARLVFNPQLVCTINWADSGPGFSWPESYHVTYLPGFEKFVVTASRDGDDLWGCSDHAIGVTDAKLGPIEAAKELIVNFWRMQFEGWDHEPWAYLFDEGLIDTEMAKKWADEVWKSSDDEQLEDADLNSSVQGATH